MYSHGMTDRENWIRTYTFTRPAYIPVVFHINAASWVAYKGDLEAVVLRHPRLFPGFREGSVDWDNMPFSPAATADVPYTDPWQCVWETSESGIVGTVTQHPLADWAALAAFTPPDPETTTSDGPIDWGAVESRFRRQREQGCFTSAGVEHGFLFLRLTYLCGFEKVLFDMVDARPELGAVIRMIEAFNRVIVAKYLDIGVDMFCFPEDLGAQDTPLLSPALFRQYIAPVYRRLIAPVKAAGVLVHAHSDGCILDLADDMIACGADIINLQDRVNGIDNIARLLKGRVAVDLDIDRQDVTRFGSPRDVDDLVREAVVKLGRPDGGLSLIYGLYPGIPLENAEAVMTAMQTYADYYA